MSYAGEARLAALFAIGYVVVGSSRVFPVVGIISHLLKMLERFGCKDCLQLLQILCILIDEQNE